MLKPDYLFETSWEVCNKVGGIYTVISTKALTLVKELKDHYILIGPDVWMETRRNPEFIEDKYIYRSWRENAEMEGLRFRIGRWNIAGHPVVILVDFTQYYALKDKIFAEFWEKYQLDSLTGQWDYTEPVIFGYAAAKIIESFYDFQVSANDRIVAQFHEWMTGSGVLYLKDRVPQVGLAFTTHATVLGRSVAGSNMPLYRDMETYNPESLSHNLNVVSKHSLEKISARLSDSFTTVSTTTARECIHFLGKEVDVVTPNGFEDSFVPAEDKFEAGRVKAKEKLFAVAEAVTGTDIPRDALLVINSGRYEFHNKGIDLYIDALAKVNKNPEFNKNILAYVMVPAGHAGYYENVKERLQNGNTEKQATGELLTHILLHPYSDPVLKRATESGLNNRPEDKVKIIFVPCYLDGNDGIFNMQYYDLLIGFDLSVFPSYYEPWGYTPLESLAFHIPTITTTMAGFGVWVQNQYPDGHGCVSVLKRNEDNYSEVADGIIDHLLISCNQDASLNEIIRKNAWEVSRTALWENLISFYSESYHKALEKSEKRYELYRGKQQRDTISELKRIINAKPEWKKVLIRPWIPDRLLSLKKLSQNLWWSWNNEAQNLFASINPQLWEKIGHNPVALIEILTLDDYQRLESDSQFLEKLGHVESQFDQYMQQTPNADHDPIAYFSMEFGLHDSLKIFSGGLGILAGDYLKEASDSGKNIIGIGLLYRYGYFQQSISLLGDQISGVVPQKFSHLPLNPVRDSKCENGNGNASWVKIKLAFPGRTVVAKLWRVDVGRVKLYLMDTDIEENAFEDRAITSQLYGGDLDMRFKQEVLLGVGGIMTLDALGIKPALYHCNEGHAAFIGLERLRKYVQDEKLSFYQAMEVVRASSLFTTHTPVPAGHDAFFEETLRTYIPHYPSRLGISWEAFINLGRLNENDPDEKFSMSVLAARLSQEMNGVSRIHGRVTQKMFKGLYPGYFPEELHISYVTNGVHFPTWVSPPMRKLYDEIFPGQYIHEQNDASHWQRIHETDEGWIWGIKQQLRKELILELKERLTREMMQRQESPVNIFKVTGGLNEKALTICFARRFATYKRAHLLFADLSRLEKLLNNPQRPLQIIFAGKAHPNDKAGQDLIKKIYEISKRPEFIGKIFFLENYDMELAKKLVSGADIWLNTPTRPQEASGTSGEKAVMNGTINFSVLDGWWAEGYKPGAGWALKEERTYINQSIQDELDSETIYTILEEEILPTFYELNENQLPVKWISYIRNTISRVAPYFTMKRMIEDYYSRFYNRMFERSHLMQENNYQLAGELSAWKHKLIRGWESIELVNIVKTDSTRKPLVLGEVFAAEITLNMNELSGTDIGIEILFGQKVNDEIDHITYKEEMQMTSVDGNKVTFKCEIPSNQGGVFDYAFRVFPKNPLLPHRQDFNLIKWL
jgi:glycogen phosphorylase/synthase